jgi:glycosyltransferase involved in cell wall biosynthesis
MPAPALLDATPLASAHATRGIGAAVRGMLEGFAALPPDDRPALLVRRGQSVPEGFEAREVRWPRWPVYRLPDPWPFAVGERAARRLAAGGVFHAVQPSLIPRGRTVVTCFDLIPASFRAEYLSGAGRAPEAFAYRHFLRRLGQARLVLVPSAETGVDVRRIAGVPPERIRVVPLATPAAPPGDGSAPDGPYVLYAGAIEPHKNAPLAIEAIALAEPGVRLVMAGPWSARRTERLRRHAEVVGAGGRIDWLGLVPPERLTALREGARAVLVPSRKEGFGLPVLEALSAGVPVLASDTPALREVGGDAATYLPLGQPAVWAAAISASALASDPVARAVRAEHGRRRAAAFSWERTARATADAYREVAG